MNDPYIVHSTKGFLWLSNFSLSKINLTLKHIEINCDIILNEEKFDKDGNPSGGDGIIYSWEPISNMTGMSLNANGNCIFGLYINNTEMEYAGLIGRYSNFLFVKNLNAENVFINAGKFISFLYISHIIENCNLLSGRFFGGEYVNSFAYRVYEKISKCNNYVDLSGTARTAGIIEGVMKASGNTNDRVVVENCNNYGDITSEECWATAGILVRPTINAYIVNCKNYGNIIGNSHTGGIVAIINVNHDYELNIHNCENYGSIRGINGNAGGILGYAEGRVTISSCVNYGRTFAITPAQIVAVTRNENITTDTIVNIYDTKALSTYGRPFFYNAGSSRLNNRKHKINLERCVLNVAKGNDPHNCLLFFNCYAEVYVSNLEIFSNGATKNLSLIYSVKKDVAKLSLKNIIVHNYNDGSKAKNNPYGLFVLYGLCEYEFEGIIFECINDKSRYYGNDFSGFYIDWKTGKMGLKALSGKGFYQGCVTKESLIDKGFAEIVIE